MAVATSPSVALIALIEVRPKWWIKKDEDARKKGKMAELKLKKHSVQSSLLYAL